MVEMERLISEPEIERKALELHLRAFVEGLHAFPVFTASRIGFARSRSVLYLKIDCETNLQVLCLRTLVVIELQEQRQDFHTH